MRVLVTGVAGFVGYHVADRLLARGDEVIGLDELNAYYDPSLKEARLARLAPRSGFRFLRVGLGDRRATEAAFADAAPEVVIHLAAQAGVRHSVSHPHMYADANLVGFLHVLEGCRHLRVRHLVYASSSSVYGEGSTPPYREDDPVAHPVSLYAATKRAGELMAHSYSHLYALPTTGLRLFTVYGPWGRPDMAYYQFARDILAGRPIRLFNGGEMSRDYTYIDDVVEAIVRVAARPPEAGPSAASPGAPARILNVGAGRSVPLGRFVDILEEHLARAAHRVLAGVEPSDVLVTLANVEALEQLTGFRPATTLEEGIGRFVAWYREYHADAPAGDIAVAGPA